MTKPTTSARTPRATPAKSLDLGVLQTNAESAAKRLKAAQRAFQKAADEMQAATEANTNARVALNQGVSTLKASIAVSDIYAN